MFEYLVYRPTVAAITFTGCKCILWFPVSIQFRNIFYAIVLNCPPHEFAECLGLGVAGRIALFSFHFAGGVENGFPFGSCRRLGLLERFVSCKVERESSICVQRYLSAKRGFLSAAGQPSCPVHVHGCVPDTAVFAVVVLHQFQTHFYLLRCWGMAYYAPCPQGNTKQQRTV